MTPYPATYRGRRVVVVADWSGMRLAAQPTAVIDYLVETPEGQRTMREVVPLSELTKTENEEQ